MPSRRTRKSTRRVATNNYTLPDSTPFKGRIIGRGDINVGTNILQKDVQPTNLCFDVTSSADRVVLFKHFKVTFTPPSSTTALNLANAFTAQCMAQSVAGILVPITKPVVLSLVNPRSVRFRIPDWLTGPLHPSDTQPIFSIIWRMSNLPITSAVSVGVEVEASGSITNPLVTTF